MRCQVTSMLSVAKWWAVTWMIKIYILHLKHFNDQCSHHIETSQLICSANQLIGFYMMGTLAVKGFKLCQNFYHEDYR